MTDAAQTGTGTGAGAFRPTDEQVAAITAPLGPQLIVAGPGSGKTNVMARRILWVVQQGLARPDQVLGLTFTNKAARRLKEEVRAVLGPDADVTISTYHAFGASLVAAHTLELDLAPGTRVLDRAQSWQLLHAVFDDFRFDRRSSLSPQVVLDDALALASRCADHLVPVEDLVADCRRVMAEAPWKGTRETAAKRLELCQVVAAYQRRKRHRELVDFDDQVGLAVRLLAENPGVAEAVRQRHPVVLLDEYQDTNVAQRRLLQLVCPPGSAVTAVGDDMQSIYAFRGAHLANILRFSQHFRPVAVRPLQTTFRFGPALVALANRIQARVTESLEKALVPATGAPATVVECFLAADDTEEAVTIAADVAAAGPPWADHAVLCRKRRLIRPIADALEEAGVPVEVVGAAGLLDRPEVVDLLAWLAVLADPSASVAMLRILGGPRYSIGFRDLAALARHGRRLRDAGGGDSGSGDLADALADLQHVPDLSEEARSRLGALADERRALAAVAGRLPVLGLAEAVVESTGLWQAAGAAGRENLLRFLDLAAGFRPVEGDPGLAAFVEYVGLLDDAEEDLAEARPAEGDAVRVMTVHQAKGLEFGGVWVPGLAGRGASRIFPDGRPGENALGNSAALPWWLREDDEGLPTWVTARQADIEALVRRRKMDEEWRLLYVACTRARRRLVCSAAHWYRGASEPQGPSEFYELVAAQTDLVTERFRHPPAEVGPDVGAKERRRAAARGSAARRYGPQVGRLPIELVPPRPAPPPPTTLSVTGLVTYARCPKRFYWTVVQPLPRRSSAAARLGTEVHRWIEQRSHRQLSLLGPDPHAAAPGTGAATGLKASFLASPWADLEPVRVEAPFVLALEGHLVRGRIDAVYQRDGRLELVDFKTGRPPAGGGDAASALQLDVYGLAALDIWAADASILRTTYCWLRPDGPPEVHSKDWGPSTAAEVRARLRAVLDGLAAARYLAAPGAWCGGCDFVASCPEGRAAGPAG